MTWLAVAAGGAAGAVCRYVIDFVVTQRLAGVFPWGTWVVNITGSLLLGVIAGITVHAGQAALWQVAAGPGSAARTPRSLRSCTRRCNCRASGVVGDDVEPCPTMGCGDSCPVVPGTHYLDWELDDPAGKPVDAVRPVHDDIEQRVRSLCPSSTFHPSDDAAASTVPA